MIPCRKFALRKAKAVPILVVTQVAAILVVAIPDAIPEAILAVVILDTIPAAIRVGAILEAIPLVVAGCPKISASMKITPKCSR